MDTNIYDPVGLEPTNTDTKGHLPIHSVIVRLCWHRKVEEVVDPGLAVSMEWYRQGVYSFTISKSGLVRCEAHFYLKQILTCDGILLEHLQKRVRTDSGYVHLMANRGQSIKSFTVDAPNSCGRHTSRPVPYLSVFKTLTTCCDSSISVGLRKVILFSFDKLDPWDSLSWLSVDTE